ncbi:unnamed protein product [Rhizoctonia solani]|uniref:Pyridoxal phosphate homeostasis protein n=1 Tax=Rhizoctonia solani TaxID=456999 RepID=A0A8H3AKR6_9AGAM|nr:unnamed protein product [Rhizoctonia solani]
MPACLRPNLRITVPRALPIRRKLPLNFYCYAHMSGTEAEIAPAARQEELTESLKEVRWKVESAYASRAARTTPPCLVAVSKYKPASDIRACYDLGQLDFGENYVDELIQKASMLPESIRWHFIGSLQSNKCKKVAGVPNLYCLHTLDSIKKADALQKALPSTRKEPLKVMIQVNTSGEDSKSGLQPLSPENLGESEVLALARHVIKSCPALELFGLMTIGSYEASTSGEENPDFQTLIRTRGILQDALRGDDQLGDAWGKGRSLALSMGMSADFEEAIKAGGDMKLFVLCVLYTTGLGYLVNFFELAPSRFNFLDAAGGIHRSNPILMRVVETLQPPESLPLHKESPHGDSDGGYPVGGDIENKDIDEDETIEEAGGEGGEYEDDGEEGGYDPDAEAEAMAQALGNQIWAELEQGIGDTAPLTDNDTATETAPPGLEDVQLTTSGTSPSASFPPISNAPTTPDPMIETIKTMLSLALSDPHVHYALITTIVPGPVANGANLYTILSNSVMEGRVNPELAQPLSILISALASGSMLVSSEHQQYAHPASQDTGTQNSALKRKRDPMDEGQPWPIHPPYNPSVQPVHTSQPPKSQSSEELLARIQSAASGIIQVLDPLLALGQPLNQSVVSSIQRQLHQVYSFVSTCPQQHEGASGSGTLQEIGGLIQVIGILNEVPIAQAIETANSDAGPSGSGRAAVGTSIYPCATCPKMFSKLSLLRAHERTHSEGRPYRCEYAGCPASFARNHDLRRHEKSHERQMFRCGGCDRLFSRRDALRRHKANDKALDECREAPMDSSTVTHDGDPPRVTRVWQNHPESGDWPKESEFEEGEIQPEAITSARYIVGTLYQTLQRHVSKGLDTEGITGQAEKQSPGQQPAGSHVCGDQNPPILAMDSLPDVVESPSQSTWADTIKEETKDSVEGAEISELSADDIMEAKTVSTLPGYGLDDEHTSLLERAIAVAAQAAQAQAEAEAEAALYEESYNEDDQDAEEWDEEGDENEQRTESEAAKLVC